MTMMMTMDMVLAGYFNDMEARFMIYPMFGVF